MGSRRRAALIALVAASAILLSGCAETRHAPGGGVSAAEIARYRDYVGGRMWEYTGLPQSMRPAVSIEVVALEDWSASLSACGDIKDAAYKTSASTESILISSYTCRMRYQLSAQDLGLLNEAQLDYLYDYYQGALIPCLRVRGVDVPEVLTRHEAVDIGRFGAIPWNPYNAMAANGFAPTAPEDVATWKACPAFPPDAIFSRYWKP